jgi:hypothetical protein
MREGLRRGNAAAAREMHRQLIGRMQEPKHGRVYGHHVASAPGEAPAIQSGTLAHSIQVEQVNDLSYAVFTDDPKAILLENGTRRMAARPNWTIVTEQMRREYGDIVISETLKLIR